MIGLRKDFRVRNCCEQLDMFALLSKFSGFVSVLTCDHVSKTAIAVEVEVFKTHTCHPTLVVSGSSMEVNPAVTFEGVEPSPDDFTWTNLAMVWVLGTSLMFHIMTLMMLCRCCCSSSPATSQRQFPRLATRGQWRARTGPRASWEWT